MLKEYLLSYRQTILTHSIALIVGFTIAYFVFTNTDYTEIENKALELENVKGQIESKESDLVPVVDLEDALKSKDAEIEDLNKRLNQKNKENAILKNKQFTSVRDLYDDELTDSITRKADKIRRYKIQ